MNYYLHGQSEKLHHSSALALTPDVMYPVMKKITTKEMQTKGRMTLAMWKQNLMVLLLLREVTDTFVFPSYVSCSFRLNPTGPPGFWNVVSSVAVSLKKNLDLNLA